MILKRIKIQNIRSYENFETIFNKGSTLLAGDIGSGKTSILLAIEFALFGLQPGQKGASLLRNGMDDGFVELEFEVDDKHVIINRSLKRKKTISQDSTTITINGKSEEKAVTEIKNIVLNLLNYPLEFAKKTKSKTMKRNVQTISEAYHSGGTVGTILSSVAQSLQELERIKKERSASIYAQMVNGYLIYVIFLGVMIGLSSILVPAFVRFGGGQENLQGAFTEIFRSLTVIQGFFAGIAIGKMAEGTIVAGLKHAVVLVIFGYTALVIFT